MFRAALLSLAALAACAPAPSLKSQVTQRADGRIEVAYPSGCRILYEESGALVTVARRCTFDERHRAGDAVTAWRGEDPRRG